MGRMKKQRRTQRPKRPRSASTDHYAEWIYTNEKFVQYYKVSFDGTDGWLKCFYHLTLYHTVTAYCTGG